MSLLELLVGAMNQSKKGGEMKGIIEEIQEADNVIKGEELRQFLIIGEADKVDKVSALLEQKLGAEITGANKEFLEALKRAEEAGQCPWCGVDLKLFLLEARVEHAKDCPCNWKEKAVIDLLHEFGCNYQPDNPGISDTSIQVRDFAERMARVVLSRP